MKLKDLIRIGVLDLETDVVQFTKKEDVVRLLKDDFKITEKTEDYENILDECCENLRDNLITDDELNANIEACLEEQGIETD